MSSRKIAKRIGKGTVLFGIGLGSLFYSRCEGQVSGNGGSGGGGRLIKAFPEAEGFGTYSLGGRGDGSQIPQVFVVDTLEDVVADDGRQFC